MKAKEIVKKSLPVLAMVLGGVATIVQAFADSEEQKQFKADIMSDIEKNYVRKETNGEDN